MRAIVIERFGGPDSLVHRELPEPAPIAGHIVCVGLVNACPGGEFPVGAKVAALTGGLGPTINGSCAEYTRAPLSNVAPIESEER
jgi:NADPH:quinone reductase-like Zn-dependent oxidoreductase